MLKKYVVSFECIVDEDPEGETTPFVDYMKDLLPAVVDASFEVVKNISVREETVTESDEKFFGEETSTFNEMLDNI
jgi:hypothetical protein